MVTSDWADCTLVIIPLINRTPDFSPVAFRSCHHSDGLLSQTCLIVESLAQSQALGDTVCDRSSGRTSDPPLALACETFLLPCRHALGPSAAPPNHHRSHRTRLLWFSYSDRCIWLKSKILIKSRRFLTRSKRKRNQINWIISWEQFTSTKRKSIDQR